MQVRCHVKAACASRRRRRVDPNDPRHDLPRIAVGVGKMGRECKRIAGRKLVHSVVDAQLKLLFKREAKLVAFMAHWPHAAAARDDSRAPMTIGVGARAGRAGDATLRRSGGMVLLVGDFKLAFYFGKSFELNSSCCTRQGLRRTTGSPLRTLQQPCRCVGVLIPPRWSTSRSPLASPTAVPSLTSSSGATRSKRCTGPASGGSVRQIQGVRNANNFRASLSSSSHCCSRTGEGSKPKRW